MTFVVHTKGISAVAEAIPEAGMAQGTMRGALHWKITIPEDGLLVENGALPSVIERPDGVDPTSTMADFGYRFIRLAVHHPQPQALRRM